jgi:hypothetical protein
MLVHECVHEQHEQHQQHGKTHDEQGETVRTNLESRRRRLWVRVSAMAPIAVPAPLVCRKPSRTSVSRKRLS